MRAFFWLVVSAAIALGAEPEVVTKQKKAAQELRVAKAAIAALAENGEDKPINPLTPADGESGPLPTLNVFTRIGDFETAFDYKVAAVGKDYLEIKCQGTSAVRVATRFGTPGIEYVTSRAFYFIVEGVKVDGHFDGKAFEPNGAWKVSGTKKLGDRTMPVLRPDNDADAERKKRLEAMEKAIATAKRAEAELQKLTGALEKEAAAMLLEARSAAKSEAERLHPRPGKNSTATEAIRAQQKREKTERDLMAAAVKAIEAAYKLSPEFTAGVLKQK